MGYDYNLFYVIIAHFFLAIFVSMKRKILKVRFLYFVPH